MHLDAGSRDAEAPAALCLSIVFPRHPLVVLPSGPYAAKEGPLPAPQGDHNVVIVREGRSRRDRAREEKRGPLSKNAPKSQA